MFPRGASMFHGGVKHSMEALKHSTQPSNIARRGLDIARMYESFHGSA